MVPVIRRVIERGEAGRGATGPQAAPVLEQQLSRSLKRRKSRVFSFFPACLSDRCGGKGSSSKALSLSAEMCLGRADCTWQKSLPAGGGRGGRRGGPGAAGRAQVPPTTWAGARSCRSIPGSCEQFWVPRGCPHGRISRPCVAVGTWGTQSQPALRSGKGSGLSLGLSFPGDAGPSHPLPMPPWGIKGMGAAGPGGGERATMLRRGPGVLMEEREPVGIR